MTDNRWTYSATPCSPLAVDGRHLHQDKG